MNIQTCCYCNEKYDKAQISFECVNCGCDFCLECDKDESKGFIVKSDQSLKLTECPSCNSKTTRTQHEKQIMISLVKIMIDAKIPFHKSNIIASQIFNHLQPQLKLYTDRENEKDKERILSL